MTGTDHNKNHDSECHAAPPESRSCSSSSSSSVALDDERGATATASASASTSAQKSCLALLESTDDAIFEGRRRIRLAFPASSSSGSEEEEEQADLRRVRESLSEALELELEPTESDQYRYEIEWYDPASETFRALDNTITRHIRSASCCRLRISARTKATNSARTSKANPAHTQTNTASKVNLTSSHASGPGMLALPWREFSRDIDTDGRFWLGDHPISIVEESNSGLGTGTNLWDGAVALAQFLYQHNVDAGAGVDGDGDGDVGVDVHERERDKERDKDDSDSDDEGALRLSAPPPLSSCSVRNLNVLELGAGTGLVGIAAHVALGARRVLVTDLEYSLGNLRANMKANRCNVICRDDGGGDDDNEDDNCEDSNNKNDSNDNEETSASQPQTIKTTTTTIDARVLDWCDRSTCDAALGEIRPDVILAADVVWVEPLVAPLVATLEHICGAASVGETANKSSANEGATETTATNQSRNQKILPKPTKSSPFVLLSYQRRSQAVGDLLFRSLREASFRIEDVTTRELSRSKIRIYRITYQGKTRASKRPTDRMITD